MNRILNLAVCSAFVGAAWSNALADGIVNGTFEHVNTCPWLAKKSGSEDPLVRVPDGNPCSYLRIENDGTDDYAVVKQQDFFVKAVNGDWVILEFDARVFGDHLAAALVKFIVTGAPYDHPRNPHDGYERDQPGPMGALHPGHRGHDARIAPGSDGAD